MATRWAGIVGAVLGLTACGAGEGAAAPPTNEGPAESEIRAWLAGERAPSSRAPQVLAHGAPASPFCRGAGYRDFDFWVGDFAITQPDGSSGGVDRLESILGGCGLTETYNGGGGRSLNVYDRFRGRWTQTYMDQTGFLLRLGGKLEGGVMDLVDETRHTPTGKDLKNRITWTPAADGSVRQVWTLSVDGGTTYALNFDGTYRLATIDPPAPPVGAACIDTYPAFRRADALLGRWASGPLSIDTAPTTGRCLIEERTAAAGYEALAFLAYDRIVDKWFRVQGDNAGFVLALEGGLVDGVLVLEGAAPWSDRTRIELRERIEGAARIRTWQVRAPGRAPLVLEQRASARP